MPNPRPRTNSNGTISWLVQYRTGGKVVKDTFLTHDSALELCNLIDALGGAQARAVLHSRRFGKHTPTLREWTTPGVDPVL